MTEDQLQSQCVKWFDEEYPAHRQMLFAVPNGGLRDRRTASIMQATGLKKGVSDLVLILHHAVIFIEMKIPGGSQSEDQIKFQERVERRGHLYFLLWNFEEFKNLIRKVVI